MTARANSLTERVTTPGGGGEWRWSMPERDARTFVAGLGRLGYDTAQLLASAALGDSDRSDPDARIPCEALGQIVSSAQHQRFTPNLGLELARVTPLGAYPLLDYLVVTSDTVGSGIHQLARYSRLIGNPVVLDIHDEDANYVRVEMGSGAASFSLEFVAALMVFHLRTETDGRFAVSSISFRHRPDDAEEFGRVLGCAVEPLSSWNGLTVPVDMWRVPLRRRDPVLRHMLESHANDALARLPTRSGLALEVQRAVTSLLNGDLRIGAIARRLGMSGRTLQRRLADEGVSYQQLLDDARKEGAGRYLNEPTLAICEVAYLLGYSEPAPFHRAFKRWYGMTPEHFRQKRVSDAR
jgi:AraC-like DNA-binding protein